MALLRAAEDAGFYGYHLTEHHVSPLSLAPSPTVFLAAAARETKRIRLGTLLYLLPLYNPLRLIEELCMLDHLSKGRLDIGVGTGVSPYEFAAMGSDFETAREQFEEVVRHPPSGPDAGPPRLSRQALHRSTGAHGDAAVAAADAAALVRAAQRLRPCAGGALWHERGDLGRRRAHRRLIASFAQLARA